MIPNRIDILTVYTQSEIPVFEEMAYRSQSKYWNIEVHLYLRGLNHVL